MSAPPLQSAQLFVTAVEAIYDAATAPSLWPQTLQFIADVTGDVGAIMVYARDDGLFGYIHSPSLDSMAVDYNETFKGSAAPFRPQHQPRSHSIWNFFELRGNPGHVLDPFYRLYLP